MYSGLYLTLKIQNKSGSNIFGRVHHVLYQPYMVHVFWSLTEGILMKFCTKIFFKLKLKSVCVSVKCNYLYLKQKRCQHFPPVKFSKGKNDIVSLKISFTSFIGTCIYIEKKYTKMCCINIVRLTIMKIER